MSKLNETRGLWILVAALLAYGCAPTSIRLDRDELSRLTNQSEIHAIHYPPSSFTVRTAGRAVAGGGGALGSLFSMGLYADAGEKMVKEYSLEDPARRVQGRFVAALQRDLGVADIRIDSVSPSNDGIEGLKRRLGNGMVIEFKTTR